MRAHGLIATRMSAPLPPAARVPEDVDRSWLARLAWPAAVAYILLFGVLDMALESAVQTQHQMLVRLVLVAAAAIGAAVLLVYSDLDGLAERERARAAEDRLEGVLLTLRELHQSAPPGLHADRAELSTSTLLSAREREVAALIAQGYTSREIGEALVISEKTADTHADHIRAKLGLRSRAEIVVWALGHGSSVGAIAFDEQPD
jgi:DNA-binding CsgD family transcriptional regulator